MFRYGEGRSHRDAKYRYETDGSHYDKDDPRYERSRRRNDRDRDRGEKDRDRDYGRHRDDRHYKSKDYDRDARDERGKLLLLTTTKYFY